MDKIMKDLRYMLTVDNSHEEDSEEFVYSEEPITDKFFGAVSIAVAILFIMIQCLH